MSAAASVLLRKISGGFKTWEDVCGTQRQTLQKCKNLGLEGGFPATTCYFFPDFFFLSLSFIFFLFLFFFLSPFLSFSLSFLFSFFFFFLFLSFFFLHFLSFLFFLSFSFLFLLINFPAAIFPLNPPFLPSSRRGRGLRFWGAPGGP